MLLMGYFDGVAMTFYSSEPGVGSYLLELLWLNSGVLCFEVGIFISDCCSVTPH